MNSLSASIQEIQELGIRGTAFRAWWELKLRSGLTALLEKRMRRRESEISASRSATLDLQSLRFASGEGVASALRAWIPIEEQALLLSRATEAGMGKILCFGRRPADYGDPIEWHLNPMTGRCWRKTVHWSAALGEADLIGDVKLTWEIGRFPHAYLIGRAAAF